MLGESNPFSGNGLSIFLTNPALYLKRTYRNPGKSGPSVPNVDGGIKVHYFHLIFPVFHANKNTGGSFHVLFKRHSHAEAWQGPPGEAMFYGGSSLGHQMLRSLRAIDHQ